LGIIPRVRSRSGVLAPNRAKRSEHRRHEHSIEKQIIMNSEWQRLIEAHGGVVDAGGQTRFPAAPREADCALMALSHLGLIRVAGADALSFLQGQLTNDVRELSGRHTHLAGQCSHKGRMLASFRVLRLDDAFYLQLPLAVLPAALKRLRMFVLRAKVSVEDASDALVCIGMAGACAPGLMTEQLPELPDADHGMAQAGGLTAVRSPGPGPRFEVLGSVEAVAPLWESLAARATLMDSDYWTLLDIRAGIPTVYPATADAFVPQMLNMQLIDGVSFTKGCYTGQEVVARMQYLGKLKRRMYLAEVESDRAPEPGDELHAPGSASEQAGGRVVEVRPSGEGRYELLAVVEIEAAEAGEVRLWPGGPRLSLKVPPYGFPAVDATP
jgi:folate-binding protein YgfZ